MENIRYIPELILVIGGLIACFAGYKFFRLTITLAGFAAGYIAGDYLFVHFGPSLGIIYSESGDILVSCVVGIILGCVAFLLYLSALKLAVTLITGIYAVDTYIRLGDSITATGMVVALVIGLIIGFLLALLVEKFQRGTVIVISAALGARISSFIVAKHIIRNDVVVDIMNSIKEFVFGSNNLSIVSFTAGMLLIVFFMLGIMVQAMTTK